MSSTIISHNPIRSSRCSPYVPVTSFLEDVALFTIFRLYNLRKWHTHLYRTVRISSLVQTEKPCVPLDFLSPRRSLSTADLHCVRLASWAEETFFRRQVPKPSKLNKSISVRTGSAVRMKPQRTRGVKRHRVTVTKGA